MNFLNYSINFSDSEPELLAELRRETNLKVLMPRMLSGHFQGLLLSFFSKMINPEKILELGTFTGYSAICLVSGLSENGKLLTIEKNDELKFISQKYFKKIENGKKITQLFGDANEIILGLNEEFDLVFIDADKREYFSYYINVFDKVKKGGYILADNVFWNGKVLEQIDPKDEYTKGIVEFNEFVRNDDRVEKITLPIRDGLMLIRKK
ncbi:MAG: class I SAM-dependent methyltransferase [Bacteroidales bacterium]|nr:class I SAM-dependent methyltransferase [Bacteroidales bacterium]